MCFGACLGYSMFDGVGPSAYGSWISVGYLDMGIPLECLGVPVVFGSISYLFSMVLVIHGHSSRVLMF